jgi:hypothetical protein
MRRSGRGSGGGIGMNKITHRSAPKTEPKAYAKRPAGAAGLGSFYGDHTTNRLGSSGFKGEKLEGGRGYEPPGMISDPVKAVGVGGGRKVYGSGSQSQYGNPAPGNPPAKSTDILNQFGPDYRKP